MSTLPKTMRAAMLLGPERIVVAEVPRPKPPPNGFLLRVEAATTCGTDVKVYRRGGHPRMLVAPTPFGHEMAGTIVAGHAAAGSLEPGDRVVVANSAACGQCDYCRRGRENLCRDLQYLNGAFAEFVPVPERFAARSVHRIPKGMGFERAALAEPLACVLHGVDACEIGERVGGSGESPAGNAVQAAVYGAGPIGLLFVAVLARSGLEVIAADPNPNRLESAARMGARQTVQIARDRGQDKTLRALTRNREGAEIVVECTGAPQIWEAAIGTARTGGLVNLFGGCLPGTRVPLDTERIHYHELTVKGVYHHRPAAFARALAVLADPGFPAETLLTGRCGIGGVEAALRAMIDKRALKFVVSGR